MKFLDKLTPYRPYDKTRGKDISKPAPISWLPSAYESDRGRIIQSAAIRRLQQKTQVFPLEKNSAVRSRLTHSLEVQQTGRHIVRTIYKQLNSLAEKHGLEHLEREVESLVEMACLMHDIGNPPFGHFGEEAINDWFTKFLEQVDVFKSNTDPILAVELKRELKAFEGNAQAFRLISSLLRLNLTYSQSASILKYTRCGGEPKPAEDSPLDYLKKKVGFYHSEKAFITDMSEHLNIEKGHRYPLAYLMEAADDISYCLADIEDGVEKGILSCEQLKEELKQEFNSVIKKWNKDRSSEEQLDADEAFLTTPRPNFFVSFATGVDYTYDRSLEEPINQIHDFFVRLRVQLIHPLVDHAASNFIDNIEQVYNGSLNRAILEDKSLYHAVIKTFKNVAVKHIFSSKEVETKELQGYRVITSLLEAYEPLLTLSFDDFSALVKGKRIKDIVATRLYNRLPNKHIRAYKEAIKAEQGNTNLELMEFYYRCRLIQDNISGMTDQFALEEYQNLFPS